MESKTKVLLLVLSVSIHASIGVIQKLSESKSGEGYAFPFVLVVFLSEVFKWLACLIIFSIQKQTRTITVVRVTWKESLMWSVPALCYAATNNLSFIVLDLLDSPVSVQIFSSLEILIVAILSVAVLGRKINGVQMVAILLLFSSVMSSQLSLCTTCHNGVASWNVFAIVLVMLQSGISAFAGVFTEKKMKEAVKMSIFQQSTHLYFYGVIINSLALMAQVWHVNTTANNMLQKGPRIPGTRRNISDPSQFPKLIETATMFSNWNVFASALVFQFTVLGLVTGAIVKHLSNIVKMFANNLALVLLVLLNSAVFDVPITLLFSLSMLNLMLSIVLYRVGGDSVLLSVKDYQMLQGAKGIVVESESKFHSSPSLVRRTSKNPGELDPLILSTS